MELLEVPKTRVIFSVLQLINQIVKDNTDFQENACLVGLVSDCTSKIPVVMSFAGPDRLVRFAMEAAYFLQQLCQSSSLTLQMFIACRGIPILVGFLEADHAKYRDMVHLAIDGMWQVFKLQRSTPRNDFCRIAAKNGILFRLVNTLYSLNEATRLASISSEPTFSASDQPDILKFRHGMIDHSLPSVTLEPSRASTSHSQRLDAIHPDARYLGTDTDGPQSSNETIEAAVSSKLPDPAAIGKSCKYGQRVTGSTQRTSTDRPPKLIESASNGLASVVSAQSEQRYLGGGRENGNLDSMPRISYKTVSKKVGAIAPNEGAASTSGIVSQTASGVLSGSGVLNARPGSATSSGLLSQMVSAEVAREYLEKVADLLLEFSQADTSVKSYMCSQSLLNRLFQMFNRIELPILLKILKCIDNLSTDPNCLENLQRADAIKYLIPNLELKDGPLVDHIHSEVLNALF
ncbi:MITOGEN-ACTIVATED KINASE KINASE KINASE [Salix viminalis]|uniref:MITOGEN-ACTIVATED KINASE KINASE KINASE n=1 Tax=Salix viminalis TaxID=40686 RepID=A0A9Q0SHZ5_SALVM|nr:MITOGEN-ACTIVATED KINASE KINASE KINASE [Salix viminalis]